MQMSPLKRELFLREGARKKYPAANKKNRKRLIKQARMILVFSPEFIENTYEEFLRTTGLYCLSEKKDDILMWSHYANVHRELRLEFDAFHDALLANRMIFGQALKVLYSEERPVLNVINIGEPREYQKALLTKSTHWEYEREWRVIKTPGEGGPGLKPFHPASLTGVIFGALISPENKQKVRDWIIRYPTKLSLYEARINEDKFKVDIEPI
jgi:hypothetical protein